jgi:ParB-like chromosome segregation protein Spo0J
MVKVNISEIKFNPFKKFINGGKLEDKRVEKLVESIEHGTLQPNFVGRKNEQGQWELSSGHHRLGAFKKKYGKDFKVEMMEAKFSDEQMLVDMIRENLTQRGEGSFRDTEASIVLARDWVLARNEIAKEGKVDITQLAKLFGKLRLQIQKGKKGFQPVNGSARSIAEFLSKNGKAVSRELVRQYLNIHDNLDKNLHKKIGNLERKVNEVSDEIIGVATAGKLATLDKATQRKAWENIKKYKLNHENTREYISKLKEDNTITPEVLTQKQYEDYEEEDKITQQIDFEQHWERVSNAYREDLIQWAHYPEKLNKIDAKKLWAQIEQVQQQENKTLQKLKELVK